MPCLYGVSGSWLVVSSNKVEYLRLKVLRMTALMAVG